MTVDYGKMSMDDQFYDTETGVWKRSGSPPPKKARVSKSCGKYTSIMFADIHGMSHAVQSLITLNADYNKRPPMARSAQASNGDLQPQNRPPSYEDEEMESGSEAEMSPITIQPAMARSVYSKASLDDLQPLDRPPTYEDEERESDSEEETLPISEQPSVTLSFQESMDNMGDPKTLDRPSISTSRDEGIKPGKGKKKKQMHRPWSHQERSELINAFSSYLVPNCRRLPGKCEIMNVQGHCKAFGNRTWLNVKYQLKNMQSKI
ncbi:hypothetical protein MAR_021629 [Mya arenaria]|uniref:Uncharacterized protein n=1 Tax=Mya arenaria TaxID=6604 RepID=A0ABY7E8A6_MYAAR|nr:hypothetical protein MAR_021629 [Mya arenaria]